MSRGDTFQSCTDGNNQTYGDGDSFKSFTKNSLSYNTNNNHSNTLDLSKSSIVDGELEILYEGVGNFYTYNVEGRLWRWQGHVNMQLIADDGTSQKGLASFLFVAKYFKD